MHVRGWVRKLPHLVIESMGMSTINLGKCEKGNSNVKRRQILLVDFGRTRGELGAKKSTNHDVLDENHYWVVFMLKLWLMCM
jgi:hypothetical protein